jgi:hypothetical protein
MPLPDSHWNDSSVNELMKRMHAKLQALLRRRAEVKRDIRNLNKTIRGLSECIGRTGLGMRHSRSQIRSSTDVEAVPDTTKTTQSSSSIQLEGVDSSNRAEFELRRACRIALMESQETASLEEVYSRIVRRESFSFAGVEYPLVAIARIVNILAEEARNRDLG